MFRGLLEAIADWIVGLIITVCALGAMRREERDMSEAKSR